MAADSWTGPTVVIDLGDTRGEPETYGSPTRRTTSSWFGPMLVVLLVLFVPAASAAPPPPELSAVLSLSLDPADEVTVNTGGDLISQSFGALSAYDLSTGQRRWTSESVSPTARLRAAGDLVLVRPWSYATQVTTAVSLATGAALWRHPGRLVTIDGSDVLLAASNVRTAAGPARRVQGAIESLDPATGAGRWRIDLPSTAAMIGLPGTADLPPRLLLVHDNRTATTHDLGTGEVVASGPMPPADYGPDNPAVSGGLILLRHLGPATAGGRTTPAVSAYDPVTLRQRWSVPAGRTFQIVPCGPLACLVGPDGVRALDPATGTERWYRPDWRGIEERDGLVIAAFAPVGGTYPSGVVDAATSKVLIDLTGWRPLPGTAGPNRLLVSRAVPAGARGMIAVAAAGASGLRPLAGLPAGSGDCQAVPDRLVCRSSLGSLVVWAYRKKL